MGTTPGGLPYPEPTDDLRDGAGAIQALAEALDPVAGGGDTGWVPITIASGFAALSTHAAPQVRRIGNIVYIRGAWGKTGFAATAAQTVGTLPDGFAPVVTVVGRAGTNSATRDASVFIYEEGNGNVEIRTNDALSDYYYVSGLSWPIG